MSEAPKTIWAFHVGDDGLPDDPGCNIIAGEKCMYGAKEYTRADIAKAKITARDQTIDGLEAKVAGLTDRILRMENAIAQGKDMLPRDMWEIRDAGREYCHGARDTLTYIRNAAGLPSLSDTKGE